MNPETIVLATRNPDKARELQALLEGTEIRVRTLAEFPECPDVEEDGETLEANALKKARSAFHHTGIPSLADDTGLEVYYLLGAPGVQTARFAGQTATYADNVHKLLKMMTQVPARRRGACFRTVVAFVGNGFEHVFGGKLEGSITADTRGRYGFGYDPVFLPENSRQTLAELTVEEKNRISHRANALAAFKTFILNKR